MKGTYSIAIILVIAFHIDVGAGTNDLDDEEHQRQTLVKEIISKMTNFSLYSFYNTSKKERPRIMNRIRQKLKLASKFTGPRSDKYVNLVMDAIHSIIASKEISDINTNKIDFVNHRHQNIPQDKGLTKKNQTSRRSADGLIVLDKVEPLHEFTAHSDDTCDCSCVEGKLCTKIFSLNKFICRKDQKVISLEKLCDGEYNCNDKSDEDRCRIYANKKLSDSKSIIKEIKKILPRRCLEVQSITDKVVKMSHDRSLANVLKKQITFLNMVAPIKYERNMDQPINETKEITLVVASVASALEGALCIREKYKHKFYRRDGTLLDKDFAVKKEKSWLSPTCACMEQFCSLNSDCSPDCNNTCWQRYSLEQHICQAVSGARTVPLNQICDGKVDCFDESDEKDCTTGAGADKFDATRMYNVIIEVLSTKTAVAELQYLLNQYTKLQGAVRTLQAQSMIDQIDVDAVKHWRDEVIAGLLIIYESVLVRASNFSEIDAEYNFLLSINKKLVDAMKLSKTGNARRVQSNECHCVGNTCMLAKCSVACVRNCAVKSVLTEHSCRGTTSTIHIQYICNGISECLEGDDEEYCTTEVCRNHHLMVLRQNLQNFNDDRWGHNFGEIIGTWKTKTINIIRVIEKMDRVNRKELERQIAETLQDLVQTYASLPENTRRSTETELEAFQQLSRVVQDTLRSCTH